MNWVGEGRAGLVGVGVGWEVTLRLGRAAQGRAAFSHLHHQHRRLQYSRDPQQFLAIMVKQVSQGGVKLLHFKRHH